MGIDDYGGGGRKSPGAGSPTRSPMYGSKSAASSSRGIRPNGGRSPSPPRVNLNDLDHRSIVALSQSTAEDLDMKQREKAALTKLLGELKKKKLQIDSKIAKKHLEVDNTVVQTMDMNKKLELMNTANRMSAAELAGLRSETEKLEAEVEAMRHQFKEATTNYDRECLEVEKAKRMLYNYRKEINAEAKQRDNIQSDLRASRTAQSLMINRLDEMEKRSRALKTCVARTINT